LTCEYMLEEGAVREPVVEKTIYFVCYIC